MELSRWEILEAAPVAGEATLVEHFTGFVQSFVEKSRRERWFHLLLKRPKQVFSDSHKLYGHLDWSKCFLLADESVIDPQSKGVYYGFSGEPVVLTAAQAFIVGPEQDGIFSIVPGQLSLYFFHENEVVLCKI